MQLELVARCLSPLWQRNFAIFLSKQLRIYSRFSGSLSTISDPLLIAYMQIFFHFLPYLYSISHLTISRCEGIRRISLIISNYFKVWRNLKNSLIIYFEWLVLDIWRKLISTCISTILSNGLLQEILGNLSFLISFYDTKLCLKQWRPIFLVHLLGFNWSKIFHLIHATSKNGDFLWVKDKLIFG